MFFKKNLASFCVPLRTYVGVFFNNETLFLIFRVDETGDYARFLLLYDDAFKTAYGGETFSEHEKFHLRSEYRYKQVHDKAERGAIMNSNIIVTTTSSFSYERYNRFTEEVKENEQNDEEALNDRDNDEDKFDDDDKVWEATKDFKIEAPSGYEKLKRIFYHTVTRFYSIEK